MIVTSFVLIHPFGLKTNKTRIQLPVHLETYEIHIIKRIGSIVRILYLCRNSGKIYILTSLTPGLFTS